MLRLMDFVHVLLPHRAPPCGPTVIPTTTGSSVASASCSTPTGGTLLTSRSMIRRRLGLLILSNFRYSAAIAQGNQVPDQPTASTAVKTQLAVGSHFLAAKVVQHLFRIGTCYPFRLGHWLTLPLPCSVSTAGPPVHPGLCTSRPSVTGVLGADAGADGLRSVLGAGAGRFCGDWPP